MEEYFIRYLEEGVEYIKIKEQKFYSVYLHNHLDECVIQMRKIDSTDKIFGYECQIDKQEFEQNVNRVIELCKAMI